MDSDTMTGSTRYSDFCYEKSTDGRVCYLYKGHHGLHKDQPGNPEWS